MQSKDFEKVQLDYQFRLSVRSDRNHWEFYRFHILLETMASSPVFNVRTGQRVSSLLAKSTGFEKKLPQLKNMIPTQRNAYTAEIGRLFGDIRFLARDAGVEELLDEELSAEDFPFS